MPVPFRQLPAILLFSALLLPTGCTPPPEAASSPPPPTVKDRPVIGELLETPASYEGRQVDLFAVFKGWLGHCPGPPPVARSDWMVEDVTGCLYVHGTLPRGMDPERPDQQPLNMKGTVRLDERGRPYLDLLYSRILPRTLPRPRAY